MKKMISLLLIFAMLFVFSSCTEENNDETTTTTAPSNSVEADTDDTTAESVIENTEVETTEVETTEAETAKAETEKSEKASEVTESKAKAKKEKLPSTKAEILAEYTKIMNQAKKDKPGFTFYEWQTLPDDPDSRIIAQGKSVIGTALNIANGFMKDEKKAKEDAAVIGKDSDMYCFPIRESDYGCLLTDPEAIKSAELKELPNGNRLITIILKDEKNPEPVEDRHAETAPSNHGAIFQPLPKKVIDDVLANDVISAITDDISYSYTYHDCTATVEYNPENNHIVSITQLSYVTISGSGKVTLIRLDVTKQEFINEMHVVDIIY